MAQVKQPSPKRRPRQNDVCRSSWVDFLASPTVQSCSLSDSKQRAIRRWTKEGVTPSIWTADRFLIGIERHLDDFFFHCHAHGFQAWARGRAPDWHGELDPEVVELSVRLNGNGSRNGHVRMTANGRTAARARKVARPTTESDDPARATAGLIRGERLG